MYEAEITDQAPVAHVIITYNGPVAPHWEMKVRYGDEKMLAAFWTRVTARLMLLPKHDPQFRRNRERVNRDAERECIVCDWDLGEEDAESTYTPETRPETETQPQEEVSSPEETSDEAEVQEEASQVEDSTTDEAAESQEPTQ